MIYHLHFMVSLYYMPGFQVIEKNLLHSKRGFGIQPGWVYINICVVAGQDSYRLGQGFPKLTY